MPASGPPGFVILATLLRPVGGTLADRIGGSRVLAGVFLGTCHLPPSWRGPRSFLSRSGLWDVRRCSDSAMALFSSWSRSTFPPQTGAVTGLVGAMGGLGGFFPPLLLESFATASERSGRVSYSWLSPAPDYGC